jgi:hypothetical protein
MKKKINAKNYQKMKNKILIPIHSIVDVITNSSTELFIIDKEKGLETVQEIVNQAVAMFPSKYGCIPSVHLDNPEYYDGSYGCFDLDEAIKKLESRGYTVIAPEGDVQDPEVIVISWERGNMPREFCNFISETFNVQLEDE